ncbi:MAG: hypothetical protein QOJ32_50, partial [Frankiaceae bacterium]|nr:hypothetical protein [Frankiaceae bacterium]
GLELKAEDVEVDDGLSSGPERS